MNKRIGAILLLVSSVAVGADDFYYRIGGAEPFSRPMIVPATNLTIGTTFSTGAAFHCGNFDFDASLAVQMANARERLRTGIVRSVEALFAALPELLLQRIRPDLYDLFQKLMIRAEADVRFAYQSCDDWLEAARDDDGIGKLFREAVAVNWQTQAQRNGDDIYQAQRNIEDNPAEQGIRWCDGSYRAGASSQALEPVIDSAVAGYNTLLRRRCSDESRPTIGEVDENDPAAEWEQLFQQFKSPLELEVFLRQAVGDNVFSATQAGAGQGRPPQGLNGLVQEQYSDIYRNIERAGFRDEPPYDRSSLIEFYPGGPRLTPDLIQALQSVEVGRRRILVERLAREVAAATVIDQALQARKALSAARTIPEIRSSEFVVDEIDRAMASLEQQIKELMFERDVRRTLVTDLAQLIIDDVRQTESRNTLEVPVDIDPLRVEQGGVIEQEQP